MALPADLTPCHLTGYLTDGQGVELNNETFTLIYPKRLTSSVYKHVVVPRPLTIEIVNGLVDLDVIPTDDPDITPVNFTVTLVENWQGGGTHNVEFPAGGEFDLSEIIGSSPSGGTTIMRGPAGGPLIVRGTVADAGDLPGGASEGDVYMALDTGIGWQWDGGSWTNIGPFNLAALALAIPDTTDNDLTLADPVRASGAVTGGVVRQATSIHVPWTYTQTTEPTDPAIGTALWVPIDVTISGHTGGSGPNLTTGWFGPRGIVNIEGKVRYGVDQNLLNFEPPGFFDGLRMENSTGVNRVMAPAWSYISTRMKIANGATVTMSNNDVNYGGAAYVDTGAYLTRNSGTIAGSATEIVSFLSQPVVSGNVTTAGRVAYDSVAVLTGDDLYLGGPTIQSVLAAATGLSGADIGTEVIPYDIHYRAQRGSDRATHNIGFFNELGTVQEPLAVTITTASSAVSVQGSLIHLNNTSGSPIVLTNTPTIPAGMDGQVATLMNVGANNITFQSSAILASSGLLFHRRLKPGQSVTIQYVSSVSAWREVSFSGAAEVAVTDGSALTQVSPGGVTVLNAITDANPAVSFSSLLGIGFVNMGPGGASAADLYMQRAGTDGTLSVGSAYVFGNGTGTGYVLGGHKHTNRVITAATDTLVVADGPKTLTYNRATAIAATLPQNSSAAIPTNVRIPVANIGAGTVTFGAGSGAALVTSAPTTLTQGQAGWLVKPDASNLNLWMLIRS